MADDVTLLPCKVCGSERAVPVRYEPRFYGPYWRVCCVNCEYDGPARQTKEEAAAAWNARVPDPRLARIDAAMTFLQERAATEEWADKALVTLAQILLEPPAPGEADVRWGAETLAVLKARGLWPTT
jgi:hypothetical protein